MPSTPRKDDIEEMDFDLVFNQPHLTPVKEKKEQSNIMRKGILHRPLKMSKKQPIINNYNDYLKIVNDTKGGKSRRKTRKMRKKKKQSKKKRSMSKKRRKTTRRRR